jgi:dihydroorotate dehydrogenase electron transfer subunit
LAAKTLDLHTTILVNEPFGSYFRLVFEVKGSLARALPGQFVNLRLHEGTDPLLRRPFSVSRLLRGVRGSVHMEVIYAVVRKGTRLLSRMNPGETLRVLGPLGNPFPHLDRKHPALLVGGGVGIPPMVHLSEYLKKKGVKHWVFLGARTKKDLVHVDIFRRNKAPLFTATDDGTAGAKGLITGPLEAFLSKGPLPKGLVIHACGPRAMFRAVAALGEKHDVPTYLSWEEMMGCGLGICLTCVCPHKDGKMERTCVEGPVFEASKIDWERLPK